MRASEALDLSAGVGTDYHKTFTMVREYIQLNYRQLKLAGSDRE